MDGYTDPKTPVKSLTPVPDTIAGNNLPYRGNVDHGVPGPDVESTDEAHYHMGRPVEYEDEPKPIDAVPVRIVGQSSREIRRFHVGNHIIDNTQVRQIAPRGESRLSVKIANLSADQTIFIGPDATISAYAGGYPIGPGKDISLVSTEPIYAVGTATPANVAVLIERTDVFK